MEMKVLGNLALFPGSLLFSIRSRTVPAECCPLGVQMEREILWNGLHSHPAAHSECNVSWKKI